MCFLSLLGQRRLIGGSAALSILLQGCALSKPVLFWEEERPPPLEVPGPNRLLTPSEIQAQSAELQALARQQETRAVRAEAVQDGEKSATAMVDLLQLRATQMRATLLKIQGQELGQETSEQ